MEIEIGSNLANVLIFIVAATAGYVIGIAALRR